MLLLFTFSVVAATSEPARRSYQAAHSVAAYFRSLNHSNVPASFLEKIALSIMLVSTEPCHTARADSARTHCAS